MGNLTPTELRSTTRRNLTDLTTEVTAALALLSMAPELDYSQRVDVAEKLMLVRELLVDAEASLADAVEVAIGTEVEVDPGEVSA